MKDPFPKYIHPDFASEKARLRPILSPKTVIRTLTGNCELNVGKYEFQKDRVRPDSANGIHAPLKIDATC